jgi:hypothetical protein
MKVARDREQPGSKARVGLQALRMRYQPQPGLFHQIVGNVARIGQSGEKAVKPCVERVVDSIKCCRITGPQTRDEPQLELSIHRIINANSLET